MGIKRAGVHGRFAMSHKLVEPLARERLPRASHGRTEQVELSERQLDLPAVQERSPSTSLLCRLPANRGRRRKEPE